MLYHLLSERRFKRRTPLAMMNHMIQRKSVLIAFACGVLLVMTLRLRAAEPATQPAAEQNTLSDAEKAAGWKLLFDGKTTAGWRGFKKDKCPPGWQVVDGTLDRVRGGGDLITVDQYDSFDLILD